MVGWRGKRNGSGDRGGLTNDNLFQYINIMRGSRNFSQKFSRDRGVQIPFPAPPFNKSMQEHIQIIMHEAVSPLQPTDSVIKQFITMHLKWFQMLTIVQCKCDKCTWRNGTLLQRFDRRLNLTLIPHLRLLV